MLVFSIAVTSATMSDGRPTIRIHRWVVLSHASQPDQVALGVGEVCDNEVGVR
jgi:hypothetical protein